MSTSFLSLFMVVFSGVGGNDLLDYLPTQAYWQSKGVEVTASGLIGELVIPGPQTSPDITQLIRQLGAADFNAREQAEQRLTGIGKRAIPELEAAAKSPDLEVATRAAKILRVLTGDDRVAAVRTLMAIRTLGEMKSREALPVLRKLLTSEQPFVADYAAEAIAAIEQKPYSRPRPSAADLDRDVWSLPKGCSLAAQIVLAGQKRISLDKLIEQQKDLPPGFGGDKDEVTKRWTEAVLSLAEKTGNIRVEAVTVGVAGEIDSDKGYGIVVGRGRYDAAAARALLKEAGEEEETLTVDGVEVLQPDDSICLILLGDDRLVLIAGSVEVGSVLDQIPGKELVAALKTGKGGLRDNEAMVKLIEGVDRSKGMWAAVHVTDSYRDFVPFLTPVDTITLVAGETEGGLAGGLTAEGRDPEALKGAATDFQGALKGAQEEINRELQQNPMPSLKTLSDFLAGVKVEAQGTRITVTGQYKGANGFMFLPWLGLGVTVAH